MRATKMTKISTVLGIFALLCCASSSQPAAAEDLTGAQIAAKMEHAMFPADSSTRRINMSIRSPRGDVVEWTGRQARKSLDGTRAMVTVLLSPESVKGFAVLVKDVADEPDTLWVYLPPVRRVRRMVSFDKLDSFLGTEFTYEDFGFIELEERRIELVGKRAHEGKDVYEIRETFAHPGVFSRVSTLVSADTFLPVRREYYDPAGELWKVTTYGDATIVESVPTLLSMHIEDRQQGGSSDLTVSAVSYDTAVKDELFDPSQLPEVAAQMNW